MGLTVEAVKGGLVTPAIAEAVAEQAIYWNDSRCEHWFFDFKVGEEWISSRFINNELTKFMIEIF
jgi:hypothetical protein